MLIITTLLALSIPVMAANDVADIKAENASFKCNDIEGAVAPINISFEKNAKITIKLVEGSIAEGKNKWVITDTIKCPFCGRTEWTADNSNKGMPKDLQFAHPFPTRKYITITVVYHLDVPKCEFNCKYAGKTCNFNCDGCLLCDYPNVKHVCESTCHKNFACPINAAAANPCNNAKCQHEIIDKTQTISFKKLIAIAGGSKLTAEEIIAPEPWNVDGIKVKFVKWKGTNSSKTFSKLPITGIVKSDTTFDVYYKGDVIVKCKCDCLNVTCDGACKPCTFTPHTHIAICDNCKKEGKNHKNCETSNPESTTNYFCVKCPENKKEDLKLGQLQKGSWKNVHAAWDPDKNKREVNGKILYCQCPVCFPEFKK
jgi:hypothetical protein